MCYYGFCLNNTAVFKKKGMKKGGIKARVTALFKSKSLNVNKASKLLGIPQRTLNRQVNEDGNVSMELLYAILDKMPDVSPEWLIMGDGCMYRMMFIFGLFRFMKTCLLPQASAIVTIRHWRNRAAIYRCRL